MTPPCAEPEASAFGSGKFEEMKNSLVRIADNGDSTDRWNREGCGTNFTAEFLEFCARIVGILDGEIDSPVSRNTLGPLLGVHLEKTAVHVAVVLDDVVLRR